MSELGHPATCKVSKETIDAAIQHIKDKVETEKMNEKERKSYRALTKLRYIVRQHMTLEEVGALPGDLSYTLLYPSIMTSFEPSAKRKYRMLCERDGVEG